MDIKLEESWKELLKDEFSQEYFVKLTKFVKSEYKRYMVFPAPKLIFRAFDECPVDNVKVVILGQDPYHKVSGYNANGLAFSVREGDIIPPSLQNIYKELRDDIGIEVPKHGNLTKWVSQGVLLLNSTLTVRAASPNSHHNQGWEVFTDAVVAKLNDRLEHLVFILWGSSARHKGKSINRSKHLVIESAHPSPLSASRGFFGSKPFSKANTYLAMHNLDIIDWSL